MHDVRRTMFANLYVQNTLHTHIHVWNELNTPKPQNCINRFQLFSLCGTINFASTKKKIEIKGTATTKFTRHVLFHLTDVNHIECYEHRNEIGQDRQTDKSPVFLYTECNILFFYAVRKNTLFYTCILSTAGV